MPTQGTTVQNVSPAKSLVSTEGIFVGFSGYTRSTDLHAFGTSWGWIEEITENDRKIGKMGGKQGTRIIDRTIIDITRDVFPFGHNSSN